MLFPANVGTSISVAPSGRTAVAGFTDGTLRLFDLTGVFDAVKKKSSNPPLCDFNYFDDDSSESLSKSVIFPNLSPENHASWTSSDSEPNSISPFSFQEKQLDCINSNSPHGVKLPSSSPENNARMKCNREKPIGGLVNSHANQRYGAVACQIHSRGVHTSLLMDVAISDDGLYAFGGVRRGSMELAAVYLGGVEAYLDRNYYKKINDEETLGILDLVEVDRHSDAKLKGFGACSRLWNGWDRVKRGECPEYLLFTGKGIKNIHIWSYHPPDLQLGKGSIWTCLYDTQTNGTTISQLYFRRSASGILQGVSKCDDQKVRVWDLSFEQDRIKKSMDNAISSIKRPKRPPYVDVPHSEGTVGICGPYAFVSGSIGESYNLINVVGLDADDLSSPFNRMELALPTQGVGLESSNTGRSRSGRQQRGDLKSVTSVAGMSFDGSLVLLCLSDGSVVRYLQDETGHPTLYNIPAHLCTTAIDKTELLGASQSLNKRMCLTRVGAHGTVLLAVSSYNENKSKGVIMLREFPVDDPQIVSGKRSHFWGFNGLRKRWRDRCHSSQKAKDNEQNTFNAGRGNAVLISRAPLPSQNTKPERSIVAPSTSPITSIALETTASTNRSHQITTSKLNATPHKVKCYAVADKPTLTVMPCIDENSMRTYSSKSKIFIPVECCASEAKRAVVDGELAITEKLDEEDCLQSGNDCKQSNKKSSTNKCKPELEEEINLKSISSSTPIPTRGMEKNTEDRDEETCVWERTEPGASGEEIETCPSHYIDSSRPKGGNTSSPSLISFEDEVKVIKENRTNQLECVSVSDSNDSEFPTAKNERKGHSSSDMMTMRQVSGASLNKIENSCGDYGLNMIKRKIGLAHGGENRNHDGTIHEPHLPSKPTEEFLNQSKNQNMPPRVLRGEAKTYVLRTSSSRIETVDDDRGFAGAPGRTCLDKRSQLSHLLLNVNPVTTVNVRLDDLISSTSETNKSNGDGIRIRHCEERQKLAAMHRGEHEMVRKKVLQSIRFILATWDRELDSIKSYQSVVESAKNWLEEELRSDREILNEMLDRQSLESESLAARQTQELVGRRAPVVQVTFPFPEVFDQAKKEFISICRL